MRRVHRETKRQQHGLCAVVCLFTSFTELAVSYCCRLATLWGCSVSRKGAALAANGVTVYFLLEAMKWTIHLRKRSAMIILTTHPAGALRRPLTAAL
jgi:hypothetical protein